MLSADPIALCPGASYLKWLEGFKCGVDRSEQIAQLKFATCARADWRLHIRGVELMQVGKVRIAQHHVALTGPMHSGEKDGQTF